MGNIRRTTFAGVAVNMAMSDTQLQGMIFDEPD